MEALTGEQFISTGERNDRQGTVNVGEGGGRALKAIKILFLRDLCSVSKLRR